MTKKHTIEEVAEAQSKTNEEFHQFQVDMRNELAVLAAKQRNEFAALAARQTQNSEEMTNVKSQLESILSILKGKQHGEPSIATGPEEKTPSLLSSPPSAMIKKNTTDSDYVLSLNVKAGVRVRFIISEVDVVGPLPSDVGPLATEASVSEETPAYPGRRAVQGIERPTALRERTSSSGSYVSRARFIPASSHAHISSPPRVPSRGLADILPYTPQTRVIPSSLQTHIPPPPSALAAAAPYMFWGTLFAVTATGVYCGALRVDELFSGFLLEMKKAREALAVATEGWRAAGNPPLFTIRPYMIWFSRE